MNACRAMLVVAASFCMSFLPTFGDVCLAAPPYKYTSTDYRFNYAVNIILKHEGGLTDDKDDPGGITGFGVSLRYLKSIGLDVDGDGDVDADDIRKLSLQQAMAIYRKNWWVKYKLDSIHDLKLATKIMDLAVNMGPSRAIKIAQKAIGTNIDGKIGPQTIYRLNDLPPNEVLNEIRKGALEFYDELISKNPKLKKFRNGWNARAIW